MNLFAEIASGIRMVILSFDVLRKHLKLIVYSAVTPMLTLAMMPLLIEMLLKDRYVELPAWGDTFLMSLVGRIAFNFVYLGLVLYHFRLFAEQEPSLLESIKPSARKFHLVLGWAVISAGVGTLLGTLGDTYHHNGAFFKVLFTSLDYGWWFVDFLIIPALAAGELTMPQGLVFVLQKMVFNAPLIIPAGGLLLLMKNYTGELIGYSLTASLSVLKNYPGLVALSQADIPYFPYFIALAGLVIAIPISAIISAAEATIATGIYVKIMGNPAHELEEASIGRLIVIGLSVLLMLFALALFLGMVLTTVGFNPTYKESIRAFVATIMT